MLTTIDVVAQRSPSLLYPLFDLPEVPVTFGREIESVANTKN